VSYRLVISSVCCEIWNLIPSPKVQLKPYVCPLAKDIRKFWNLQSNLHCVFYCLCLPLFKETSRCSLNFMALNMSHGSSIVNFVVILITKLLACSAELVPNVLLLLAQKLRFAMEKIYSYANLHHKIVMYMSEKSLRCNL
jgi:hypothetical protein